MEDLDKYLQQHSHDRTTSFQSLMRNRVREILLVSSLYDSFLLAQDGQLHEQMISEFMELNLQHAPLLTRASTAEQALEMADANPRINLVLTTMHVGDMHVLEFAQQLRKCALDIPIVLLAFDNRELKELLALRDTSAFDRIFLWQGDFRILLAIVKHFEDRWNVDHDTRTMGVQAIIFIEDNIHFYSSYLPMMYAELMRHSQSLISESVNLYHKLLRMRARPKVLLCDSFEEAWQYYTAYEPHILGIISDLQFLHHGKVDSRAGPDFIARVRERRPDIPVLLQSSETSSGMVAQTLGSKFVLKESPTLHHDLRQFMVDHFGFGDFVFRLPDGTEIDRAANMRELEAKLPEVPDASLRYHAERDHFSNWLKARTEFDLAETLKPKKVSDYPTLDALRTQIIDAVRQFRCERTRGHVADFQRGSFDGSASFMRIGGGSLGGKARGLAFVNHILNHFPLQEQFDGVQISIPACIVLCTDVFDRFLERNNLRDFALQAEDEAEIERRFLAASLPADVREDLAAYLKVYTCPLAVRSSSLLEDSQFHPFAGVYQTFMLANNHTDPVVRLAQLEAAVKRVYASTFSNRARGYMAATPYRLEEEKMAVILQTLVGAPHDTRFYPDISGVARSHNFYPTPPLKSSDGVVSVALGLGRTVVEGERALRFCPRYPRHLIALSTPKDLLEYTQRSFFALDLARSEDVTEPDHVPDLVRYSLDIAEQDGTLSMVGAVYSQEENAVYDGLSRAGVRIVNFAPILKHDLFPLPELVSAILRVIASGMNCPVEMEFAARLAVPRGEPKEFDILQVRPLVISRELDELEIRDYERADVLCQTSQILGVGRIEDLRDIVVVDHDRFERAASRDVAAEIGRMNAKLNAERIPYLLIGVGRWGSADPWLGIPVSWEQISGARVIVEAGFKDFKVTPSQGAHFFQNLTAQRIGYFTVNVENGDDAGTFIDWDWLKARRARESLNYVRHIQLSQPLLILMNGHRSRGVILKPSAE